MVLERISMNNKLIINNNTAWFMWIFTVIWVTISLIFIDLAIRELEQLGTLGQLFVFVITGLGSITLISFSYNQFIVKTIFDKNQQMIYVTKTYIRKRERFTFSFNEINDIRIEVTKDSDGDPYYHLNLCSSSGEVITIKEANYKDNLNIIINECEVLLGRQFFLDTSKENTD